MTKKEPKQWYLIGRGIHARTEKEGEHKGKIIRYKAGDKILLTENGAKNLSHMNLVKTVAPQSKIITSDVPKEKGADAPVSKDDIPEDWKGLSARQKESLAQQITGEDSKFKKTESEPIIEKYLEEKSD